MTPPGPPRRPDRPRPGPRRPDAQRRGVAARDAARPRPSAPRPGPGRPQGRLAPLDRPAPARRSRRGAPVLEPRPRTARVVVRRGPVARPQRRLVGALLVLLVAFGAVAVRLVQVQALGGERYKDFGASQRFQSIELPAPRGSIFDRNGHDLAVTLPQRTVWADPSLIDDPIAVAAHLGKLLEMAPAEVARTTERLQADTRFAFVQRRVADDLAERVTEAELPGIFLLDEPTRFTPSGDLARSVLGTVGVDNEGLSGLERQYEGLLAGVPGQELIEKDPDGRTIPGGRQELEPAQRGDDLVLTIDRAMQYETERALAAQVTAKGARGGIAVVSDPTTGEILALANLARDPDTGEVVPTADNKALTASFEPGSVNKLITVAAAIEEGLVSPGTELVVPDRLQVGDHEFTDHDPHPTERYSVTKVLTESSNVGTIKVAQMLGKARLDQYLRAFGFGSKTSIGFPGEAAGILLPLKQYNSTSMGSIPIGQGIAVTALQMLAAYNTIANGGVYVEPKLVLETVGADGTRHPTPAVEGRRVVSERTAEQVRAMLADVVAEGTGSRGGIVGYTVAGKTGTARKPMNGGYEDAQGNYHYVATFAGFVPAERPRLSAIVVIDEPTGDIFGGSVAAPVFADLAQYGLRLFRVPPPVVADAPAPESKAARAQAGRPATADGRVRAQVTTASTDTAEADATEGTDADGAAGAAADAAAADRPEPDAPDG